MTIRKQNIVIATLLVIIFVSVGCTASRQPARAMREQYPTFYIGEFSWRAMIFKDSTIYTQNFSDGGGMLSDPYRIGNWKFVNDSTLELYNFNQGDNVSFRRVYLERINPDMQLLIPEQSRSAYRQTLRTELHSMIINNPYRLSEDEAFLIKSDSARLYQKFSVEHYKTLIRPYLDRLDKLGVYHGKGF